MQKQCVKYFAKQYVTNAAGIPATTASVIVAIVVLVKTVTILSH